MRDVNEARLASKQATAHLLVSPWTSTRGARAGSVPCWRCRDACTRY